MSARFGGLVRGGRIAVIALAGLAGALTACDRSPEGEPMSPKPGIHLGSVTAPSGALVLVDAGLLGDPWSEVSAHSVVVPGVPPDETLRLSAAPWEWEYDGRVFTEWSRVSIDVAGAREVVRSEEMGVVAVDMARILVIDAVARDRWRHDEAIDGRADFVFWGRDAARLAEALRAPLLEGDRLFGWRDLPVGEAERRSEDAEARRREGGMLLMTDLRPHSDHWRALESARASPDGAADFEIADTRACLLLSPGGDGHFPVFRDLDADGRLVRIRIELLSDE